MADKPAEQKMGPELSSVLNFIPSAYYDLIARVCPGLAPVYRRLLVSRHALSTSHVFRAGGRYA